MIGKATQGSGFAGLLRYLERGPDGRSPERVDWIEARNLPTEDPRTAGILMRATAHESDRVEKPVYHLSISFDHGDPSDRRTVSQVADRVLSDLGLEEHQVLMVAHRDKEHAHVPLAINRVHPETGRAWDPSHDYARVEQSLRRQERELGLREVPGHHFQLEGQKPPDRSDALTSGQLKKWERTGHLPFDELVRKTAARDFREASTWEDLEQRLARRGLRLEPRGRGLVVTDGTEVVKASSVARDGSRPKLEQRFGVRYGEHRKDREHEPVPGPARTAEAGRRAVERSGVGRDGGEVDHAAAEPERDGRAPGPRAGRDGGPERETAEGDRRLGTPERRGDDRRRDTSRRPGAKRERRRAEPDVPRGTVDAAGRSRAVDADRRDPAGARGGDPRGDRGDAGDAELGALKGLIAKLERRVDLEKARERAGGDLDRARAGLTRFKAHRWEAREAAARFKAALGDVYRDPVAARRAIKAFTRREGVGAAVREVGSHPERFGELCGAQHRPIRSAERKKVVLHAGKLSRASEEYLRKVEVARGHGPEYRKARLAVVKAEAKVRRLDAELERGPGAAQLRLRIRGKMRSLQPQVRREMNLRLSPSQRLLVGASVTVGVAFVREQGHER